MKHKDAFSITFLLRKEKMKKTGLCPIVCRITASGQRTEIHTRLSTTNAEWQEYLGQPISRKQNIRQLKAELVQFEARVRSKYKELATNGKTIEFIELKYALAGKKVTELSLMKVAADFYDYKKSTMGRNMKAGSINKYRTTNEHLHNCIRHFYGKNDLPIESCDYVLFNRFEQYLLTKGNNGNNGMAGHLHRLKRIADHAVACGFLSNKSYEKHTTKIIEPTPVFLEWEELARIQGKHFKIQRLEDVKNLFLFSCYTGLAFIDVQSLSQDKLIKGIDGKSWIITRRTKTRAEVNLPILEQAQQILDIYRNDERFIGRNQLLPRISNQKMNAYLKEIADICGVNKNLATHSARHTFATTICAGNGVPIDTAQKLLGHKNITTTKHYYRTSRERIARDMDVLQGKLRHSLNGDDGYTPPTQKVSS